MRIVQTMKAISLAILTLVLGAGLARAGDELVTVKTPDGTRVPYVLTTNSPQKIAYAVILMPGGNGQLNPRMESGRLVFAFSGNFLIRSRALFADRQFVAASTNATTSADRILAIVADLEKRYGRIQVYVVGTSRSTESTMSLSKSIDGKVAGFVHSSSMNAITGLDARSAKSRHLIVLHRLDACRATSPSAGQAAATRNGLETIVMDGGKSTGDDCEAYAHHGFYGIERETVDRMKAWIVQGN